MTWWFTEEQGSRLRYLCQFRKSGHHWHTFYFGHARECRTCKRWDVKR